MKKRMLSLLLILVMVFSDAAAVLAANQGGEGLDPDFLAEQTEFSDMERTAGMTPSETASSETALSETAPSETALSEATPSEASPLGAEAENEELLQKPAAPSKLRAEEDDGDYLTFSSNASFTLHTDNRAKNWNGKLYYATGTPSEAESWNVWNGEEILTAGNNGENWKLYLRGTGNTVITGSLFDDMILKAWRLSGEEIQCTGNIETLLDYEEVGENIHPEMAANCFFGLFYGCASLTEAPELPAPALATGCYYAMFYECTSLTEAPELPAETLAVDCYIDMFSGCTSLGKAPELPAETLAEGCYCGMFSQCSELTEAPELPAETLAASCYTAMFSWCTKLEEAPELPATVLESCCYEDMFSDCSSLTEAPELPAETLAEGCYCSMFWGCTSLTEAPELPAETLESSCYGYMFYGCTSLEEAPELPAETLAEDCYYTMFSGCTSLTEVPELPATVLEISCYEGMFCDCTGITLYEEGDSAWSIPSEGVITATAKRWNYGMFKGTGGTVTEPKANITYYQKKGRTVSFQAAEGGQVSAAQITGIGTGSPITVNGSKITIKGTEITADPDQGYTFKNWSGLPESMTVTEDLVITACFYAPVQIAVIAGEGGSVNRSLLENVPYGSSISANGNVLTVGTETVTATSTEDYYFSEWIGIPESGKATENLQLTAEFKPRDVGYLTFSSTASFTLQTDRHRKGWNGRLYYATGTPSEAESWSEWDGTDTLTAGNEEEDFRLYLRGTGNTVICGGAKWILSGEDVHCSGNIETLLDYETVRDRRHPEMGRYCFQSLFSDCTALAETPELPAVELKTACYYRMFYGCTGLTEVPELPATTLAQGCYYDMFNGCTGIALYEEGSSEWRIPAEGTVTETPNLWNEDMFSGTSGTVTEPEINTVYYQKGNFTVSFQAGAHGSVSASQITYVGIGTPVAVNDNVITVRGKQVTATADEGYSFAGWSGIPEGGTVTGNMTLTAEFTVKTCWVKVVLSSYFEEGMKTYNFKNVPYGTPISTSSNTITIGTETVTAVPKAGYRFFIWNGLPSDGIVRRSLAIIAIPVQDNSGNKPSGDSTSGDSTSGDSTSGDSTSADSTSDDSGTAGPNASANTYSEFWCTDTYGNWNIRDKGQTVANAWLCDDAVAANGQRVWYILKPDGAMLVAGLVRDNTGNYYSIETNHNGYYGSLRYQNGVYNCSGQQVYLEFSNRHDGTFGAITNADGIEKLKAIYGVTECPIGNENCRYTAAFTN